MENKTNDRIVYIDINHLYPHPNNPRKNIGDVTELAESIKAKGVLQNLTVIPANIPNDYIILIGHRRYTAAKLAGITELPCTIVEMSKEDQIATMLVENMQRSDLTVYEEAKGFQMMIDLGKTVSEISEISGFSETTVRKRVKLAELDEEKFKKACQRGATLFDFAELEKVEDPAAKERCLDVIGTNNFKNVLKTTLDDQKTKKKMENWIQQLETFAIRIEQREYVNGEYVEMNYCRNYGSWTSGNDVEIPSDSENTRYFFTVSDLQISLYREAVKSEVVDSAKKIREEIQSKDDARWERAKEIVNRHKALRREFAVNFNASKTHAQIIMRNCVDSMLFEAERNYYSNLDVEDFCNLLGIPYDKERKCPDPGELRRMKAEQPERVLLLATYWYLDKYGSYVSRDWDSNRRRYVVSFRDNQKLDALYYFLEELGYERSSEEVQMSRGTHEVFGMDSIDGKALCILCKSAHPQCDKCCRSCTEKCNAWQECRSEDNG